MAHQHNISYAVPYYLLQDAMLSQRWPHDAPWCSEKIWESLATPTANFPDILMDLFRSIRKKSCGSGSAVCTPLVCAVCHVTLGFPATKLHGPSYWNKAYL